MIRSIARAAPAAPPSFSGYKKQLLSEMIGTFLLVFIGPASVVLVSRFSGLPPFEALVLVALVFGCTVGSIILLLGRHSGAHINPAITVASTLARQFRRELLIPYVAFQVMGGLLAGMALWILFSGPSPSAHLGATSLAVGVTPIEGVSLEIAGTFVLAFAALSASAFVRSPVRQAALVGSTLFFLIILIGPLTGASFNPVRSLGPALFSGLFAGQLVFWVGPLIGAALAGLSFGMLRRHHG